MICQHIAVEDLLQLFALFAVSNIPLVRFQQFCGIFLTEIRCLQCLQITGIHLKHIFVSLFAGTLVVGGNDCDKPSPPSAESVRHDFEELINTSLSKSKSVTVCCISPRVTTEEIKETISSVNAELVALCEEKENVTFVDIDPMFKLSDGSFNDGCLMGDGVHLTDKALNKIALKLNLRMKDKDGGFVTDRMQMGASYGDESWLTVPSYRTGQTKNMQSQPNANVQTSSEGWKTVNYHTAKGHGLGMSRRPVSYAEVVSHTTSSWCYNCDESGHISNSCRFNSAVECHKCHRLEHKQKLCHLYK